jgi:beta-galactosidase
VRPTAGAAASQLLPNKPALQATREDLAANTVQLTANNRPVPSANRHLTFSLSGPGRIISVGNAAPPPQKPGRYLKTIRAVPIENLREQPTAGPETAAGFDDTGWPPASAQMLSS